VIFYDLQVLEFDLLQFDLVESTLLLELTPVESKPNLNFLN
jgi:hypothetical protein